jgi:hypothetical protein
MASVTTWTRLEPTPRQATLGETLRAKIYDPFWMLTRQWQLGEFQGEDNGSPVTVSLHGESSQPTRFMPGPLPVAPAQGQRFDSVNLPLEVLVEREQAKPVPDFAERLQFAAEAGQHFLRILARESFGTLYHVAFIDRFPLANLTAAEIAAAGRDSVKFLALMSGRVPNGAAIAVAARQPDLPSALGISPEHEAAVRNVCDSFLRWYDLLFSEPLDGAVENPAWSSRRMEYAFAVAGPYPGPTFSSDPAETVLVAREYPGGELDWFDFDIKPGPWLGADADHRAGQNPLPIAQTVIPSVDNRP